MSADNLALWASVETTDPKHTKPITGKAYSGTSPKPYYLVRRATETFGPCGIGWGFEIVEEKIIDGATIEPGVFERVHTARVRVWYEWKGKRGTVEHVGQTMFCGRRKSGTPYTDEDAPKKSVTDALIKALSMIGFAGDIFIGLYDDSKYISDLRRRAAHVDAEADDEPADDNAALDEQAIITDLVNQMQRVSTLPALEALRKDPGFVQAVKGLSKEGLNSVTLAGRKRREQLEGRLPKAPDLGDKLAASVAEARTTPDNLIMAG